jgi:DNA mismatch repair protein MutS2
MIIEKAARESLEIAKIARIITKHCRSTLGENRAAALKPAPSLDALNERRELFGAIELSRETNGEIPWNSGISSIAELVAEARENGVLTGPELIKIRDVLTLAMKVKERLNGERDIYPVFSSLTKNIADFTEELEAMSVIGDDGRLYDSASDKLKSVREEMRSLRDRARKKCAAIMNDPAIAPLLQERVVSLRGGRHAFLVRSDAISLFPGIAVDRSGTGISVYMEPHSLITLNNRHAAAQGEESAEELKILRRITERIIKRERPVLEGERALGLIDLFYALSEIMRKDGWKLPEISKRCEFKLTEARHPLLGAGAVPIDIACGGRYRILLITGPNTGGKTVALKTAGVCVYLAWLGFPIPADEGSLVGDIDALFADIGDEQSIEQSLSTFSGHVTHVKDILDRVSSKSLVLLDELGAGTDPEEGAALGIAIMDWLLNNGALVLATTHHNPIKRFALRADKIETASVEFDISTLSPTYKLLTGIPGKSNALLIAGKLGMPKELIGRAKSAMNGKEISMEDLIGELQEKKSLLEAENRSLKASRAELESIKKGYEDRLRSIEQRRDELISGAEKKAVSIVRNAEESAKALIKNLEAAPAEPDARRELEKKRSHFSKIERAAAKREEKKIAKQSVLSSGTELERGNIVRIIGTKGTAEVISVRGKKAVVQAGPAKVEVPLSNLTLVRKAEPKNEAGSVQIKVQRPVGVPSSIMVRGMTKDEAIPMVEQYLDQAYRAGYDVVSVIHGRGEGILRKEVQLLCKRIPYVGEHYLGGVGEGGYGVTVVKFKR